MLAPEAGDAFGELLVIRSVTKLGAGETVMLVAAGPTLVSIAPMMGALFYVELMNCNALRFLGAPSLVMHTRAKLFRLDFLEALSRLLES